MGYIGTTIRIHSFISKLTKDKVKLIHKNLQGLGPETWEGVPESNLLTILRGTPISLLSYSGASAGS